VVEDAGGFATPVDDPLERVPEVAGTDRLLAVVVVDVEHPALDAGVPVRLEVEHGGLDSPDVQDAGRGEPAEAGADDGDGVVRGQGVPLGGRREVRGPREVG